MLELLHLGGRSLPHAVLMMIPEAWENNATMDPSIRGFAEFHASLIEPWDGPACVTFTDGTVLGAVLDRNGLRPGRWWLTTDDTVVLASEAGVLPIPPEKVLERGRLQPGRMFLVDTDQGRILDDTEVKRDLAADQPYRDWVHAGLMRLTDLPAREHVTVSHRSVLARQKIFGYTEEELRVLITPMAAAGAEGIGSMGTDTPEAVLSTRPRLIFDYFSQLFAQVTNPPLDAIREAVVTSLSSVIGPEANLLEPGPWSCRQVVLPFPVLDNDDLAKLMRMNAEGNLPGFASASISGLYDVGGGAEALAAAIERCRSEADEAIANGARVIMLSDRHSTAERAPIPSLLLTSAVHQHLVRQKSRTKVALVVESGDAREVHHIALLLGYGAGAVNPYLVLESAEDLVRHGRHRRRHAREGGAEHRVRPRQGRAQGDEQDGHLHRRFLPRCPGLRGLRHRHPGAGRVLHRDHHPHRRQRTGHHRRLTSRARHALAFVPNPGTLEHRGLEIGGQYKWRREGEIHLFNPETVYLLQHSTRSKQEKVFRRYTDAVDKLSREGGTLRGLFALKTDESVGGTARRGGTGLRDRQAIRHRCDVLRLHLGGGPHDAGHRDEQARREVQHR